jgi:hypothetical protein
LPIVTVALHLVRDIISIRPRTQFAKHVNKPLSRKKGKAYATM